MAETELRPTIEMATEDGYVWKVYSPEDTGLMLVELENPKTGVNVSTPITNPEKRSAAHKAWAGARHSRAPGSSAEIMHEMGERGVDPDQKLEQMFATYGHASVGDMARLQVNIENAPMHVPFALFNEGATNSGQEKSTRYQKRFGGAVLHSIRHYLPEDMPDEEVAILEADYQSLGVTSQSNYESHKGMLTQAFTNFYKPEPGNSTQNSALDSRVMDCARYDLLFGQDSGFSYETSARDWSRIIGELRASPLPFYRGLADQVQRLLTPSIDEEDKLGFLAEAPGLIRHTEAATTTNRNLAALQEYIENNTNLFDIVGIEPGFKGYREQQVSLVPREFTEGQKMAAQYIQTLYPGLDFRDLLNFLRVPTEDWSSPGQITEKQAVTIGKIIAQGHNNYDELPPMARVTGQTVVYSSYLGEARDWNRHRSMGRFVDLPLVFGLPIDHDTALQIVDKGYGLPLYLADTDEFVARQQTVREDLEKYYDKLYGFIDRVYDQHQGSIDYAFVINLLPMAHRVNIWMHGDPKSFGYKTSQRSRTAGHINYRSLAFKANQGIASSDPYLEGMRLPANLEPDPFSREQFFERS